MPNVTCHATLILSGMNLRRLFRALLTNLFTLTIWSKWLCKTPSWIDSSPLVCFLFPAVVLLNSKETQAELGWTSYPPNGVSVLTCIFHCPSVCLFCSPASMTAAAHFTSAHTATFHPSLPHPSLSLSLSQCYYLLLIIPSPSRTSLPLPVRSSSLSLIDCGNPG